MIIMMIKRELISDRFAVVWGSVRVKSALYTAGWRQLRSDQLLLVVVIVNSSALMTLTSAWCPVPL